MKHVYWVFGLIAGVLSSLTELFYYSSTSDLSTFRVFWIIKMFVLAISVIFGIIAYKKLAGGIVSIARAILTGGLISLVRAIVLMIGFLIMQQSNAKFFDKPIQLSYDQIEQMVEDGKIERAEVEEKKENLAYQFSFGGYSISTLFGSLITGIIVSILVAAFVAKNRMHEE